MRNEIRTAALAVMLGLGSLWANAEGTGQVDLNQADGAELQALKGIGPSLAAAIIAYREANGGFSSVEELTRVRGIGEQTLERLRPHLVITASSAE